MNWSVALRLGRVSNLPTVWTNVLTGVVICGAAAANSIIGLILAMSLFYIAGMYLNDAFDREIDNRERPERPIPSGLVAAQTVFGAGFGMIGCGFMLLLWLGYATEFGTAWRGPVGGLALAAAIVFYDWRHKNNPLSPLLMGICRMLVYITAGAAVAATIPAELITAALVLLCYLIGLTYVAKQETLQKISNLWPLLFLAAPFLYGLPIASASLTGLILYAGFLAWVLYALSLLVGQHVNVPRAVVSLIAGICLLDALLIAGQGQFALAWTAVGGFTLTLFLQRFIAGT